MERVEPSTAPAVDPPYSDRQRFVGALLVLGGALLWGLIPVFLRLADGATTTKIWIRIVSATAILFFVLIARGRLGHIKRLGTKKVRSVAIQGLLLAFNWMLFLHALDGSGSVALAELLGYTAPVLVALMAPLLFKERLDPRVFVAIALALGGLITILAPMGFSLKGEALTRGLLGLASAITIAGLNLRAKRIVSGVPGDVFLFIELSAASVALAPIAIPMMLRGQGPSDAISYGALIGGLALICTVTAGMIHLAGFRRIRVDHSAVICYAEPVSAILYTAALPAAAAYVPILGRAVPEHPEPFGILTIVGAALVVAAGVFIIRSQTTPEVEPVVAPEVAPVIIEEEARL